MNDSRRAGSNLGAVQNPAYSPLSGKFFRASRLRTKAENAASDRPLLTFVIAGAGPTGVELAGALAEISRHTLKIDFRHINPEGAQILLVDAVDRVLVGSTPELSASAARVLEDLGVAVLTNTRVADIRPGEVTIETDGTARTIRCERILCAAADFSS